MPVWRINCSFGADSALPKDRIVITPHFNDQGVGTDPDGLCEDLATALDAWDAGGVREVRCQAYDAQGTPPVYPQGDAIRNAGLVPATGGNRETALCLSYYSQVNRAKHRGRLFIPMAIGGQSVAAARPGPTVITKTAALVPIFADLGGADVDWCVYSRVDDTPRSVSHWWIDDSWDVVRSRGLSPTSRTSGTVSE